MSIIVDLNIHSFKEMQYDAQIEAKQLIDNGYLNEMKNKPIYRCRVNKRWRSTAHGLICFWVIKDLFVHQMQSLNILIKEIIAAFLIHLDWRYSPLDGYVWLDEVLNALKVSSTQQYLIISIVRRAFTRITYLIVQVSIFFLQNYLQARNLTG